MPTNAIKYLPIIILIGLAIGVGNYSLGVIDNLGQALIQNTLTSLLIGFPLVVISEMYPGIKWELIPVIAKHFALLFSFIVIGVVASEIEVMFRKTVFEHSKYVLFSGGGLYVFNAIISTILGYSFIHNVTRYKSGQTEILPITDSDLTTIPLKKGQTIELTNIDEIILFEANDKFSFAHTSSREKRICDYSLSFLEPKLPSLFLRVHRKYLINKTKIKQIVPYGNGRYHIKFKNNQTDPIITSQSYAQKIKLLIKL